MGKSLSIFFVIAFTAQLALASDLIQNVSSRNQISLNGQWNVIVDPYDVGDKRKFQAYQGPVSKTKLSEFDFDSAMKLQVPGDWNTQAEELFFYEGSVWYQKFLSLDIDKSKRYILHFDAVNYLSHVFVNGKEAGVHEGGFTPFEFDVTGFLQQGKNSVVVKVNNRREPDYIPTMSTDWWNYGGITRPVRLLELEKTYVKDYALTWKDGEIDVSVEVEGPDKADASVKLSIPELKINKTFRAGNDGKVNAALSAEPSLWTPESPYLYNVKISLNDTDIEDKVGFRTISVDGNDILLNGKPVFLRGIAIHEEKPGGDGRAWSVEDARVLLGWAKELGTNYVRLAHYPHNENMLRVADELGLLVWAEIPVYWDIQFENDLVLNKAIRQFSEMLDRDKNRASVILWSIANETPNTPVRTRFLTKLADSVRSTDPTRLITAAINTQSVTGEGRKIDEDFANVVDVIGINTYCGWYEDDTPEECAEFTWESKFDKPIIVSEFGAGALQGNHGSDSEFFTEEYQSRVFRNNLTMLENMDNLRGVSPWLLKDFRSPRRPLSGVQDYWNRKGLMSEQGIKKDVWYLMKKWYAEKAN
ncbi:MAG: beta-glucuronidase [Alteromonadaceae bacterium]|nr:beta-glucuronidase [Alteromonadaceae bacterium]MBT82748.1 beta-glucuronidase [Alteromonadaceae bacterium]